MVDFLSGQSGVHVQRNVEQEAGVGHVIVITPNHSMVELIVLVTVLRKNYATPTTVQVCSFNSHTSARLIPSRGITSRISIAYNIVNAKALYRIHFCLCYCYSKILINSA